MAKGENQSVRNGIVATVVGGLILSALYAVPHIVQATLGVFTSVLDYFSSGINIPHWLLWLLIVLSLITLSRLIAPLLKRDSNDEPDFRRYTQDSFEGVIWRWSYDRHDTPINILPFCPYCDAMLVHVKQPFNFSGSASVSFYCESCKQVRAEIEGGDRHYAISMIERFIDRKLRNGEWKGLIRRDDLTQGV